jgi:hypothetical protein
MHRSTRVAALAAAFALALPATAAAAAQPARSEAPSAPTARASASPLSLWAPKKVTAYAYQGKTWTDLGLRAIAHGAAFEVWSTRASYDDRIRSVWRTPAGDVALPGGSMTDFSGLDDFLRVRIEPAHGTTLDLKRKVCLNGWSERVEPNAVAESPYPSGCWNNPFSLGSVQGIQAGWATTLLGAGRPFRIGAGKYTVTATITPRYAKALGIAAADATRTVKLVVEDEEAVEEEPGHGDHGDHGDAVGRAPAAHRPTGRATRQVDGPTPDLRALPAWGISLSRNSKYLRFSATVWNGGTSPLVVDGFRQSGKDLMDAYQYFFDGTGRQTGFAPVGQLHWDAKPSHQHWHFEDFARYSLLRKDKTEAAVSKKEAFCLANTDAIDLTVPDALWKPENTDLATSCGDYSSLSIREVLAAGWGDTYTQYRAGQSFRVDDLPNGVYFVSVVANPDGNLVETTTDNNVALRRIRLGGTPTDRTVKVSQVGMIDDEAYGGTG